MKKVFKVVFIILLVIIIGVAGVVVYVKAALPNVGDAPDIKVAITPERVARGKYLANHVTVCMDCHSHRDWSIYAGPIKEDLGGGGEKFGEELGFPGTLYSRNITPYALSNWTDGEIFRTITTGENKYDKALFPLMGYLGYGKMDKEDIYSIIAYVRTLAPVKNDVPDRDLDFPVNIIVNTMPSKAALSAKPDTTNVIAYGKYLVTAANCVECHSKVDKGKRIAGTEFGGGREFNFPNGTIVTSANITPDKENGIGNWSEEIFIQKFKQYTDTSYLPQQVGQNDFNTVMPWLMFAGMTKNDLSAIYKYLRTVKPLTNRVEKFTRKEGIIANRT
jgi:mono/diheme cytochrome c family protein